MLTEALEALAPRPGGRYVDGTLGRGGHAEAILQTSSPTGQLFGCDRDASAVEWVRQRLATFADRCELRQGNFSDLDQWIEAESCDGVILDLGLSSVQLDDRARGFSFRFSGPLDMRFDPLQGQTAADIVNRAEATELERILRDYGGEPAARRLARAIVLERPRGGFTTTTQLADFVCRLLPRGGRAVHPATRAFQALRIAVNDEFGALERGLAATFKLLRPAARLAVITFHSGEDRIVKAFGRALARDYSIEGYVDVPELRKPRRPELIWVSRKAIRPTAAEVAENPRARSAQLRVMQKI